jgi:sulfur-oxidizing protein SoxA
MRITAGPSQWVQRALILSLLWAAAAMDVFAGPEEDRAAFQAYFQKRFPDVPLTAFVDGIYALDEDARRQWQEIEEFPPYEFAVDSGRELFETPFANGRGYGDCFENGGIGVRQSFPRFDSDRAEVVTLELAINDCREANDEPPYAYEQDEMLALSAYMAWTSRGKTIEIHVPDDTAALEAYEQGKRFYYSKRGQLNLACADCHVASAGSWVRADRLSSSLGHPSHFPVYRSKFGRMISLHSRFYGCVRDVRAKPFAEQSVEFRNLEYFLTYMSNGLPANGPGARK